VKDAFKTETSPFSEDAQSNWKIEGPRRECEDEWSSCESNGKSWPHALPFWAWWIIEFQEWESLWCFKCEALRFRCELEFGKRVSYLTDSYWLRLLSYLAIGNALSTRGVWPFSHLILFKRSFSATLCLRWRSTRNVWLQLRTRRVDEEDSDWANFLRISWNHRSGLF